MGRVFYHSALRAQCKTQNILKYCDRKYFIRKTKKKYYKINFLYFKNFS